MTPYTYEDIFMHMIVEKDIPRLLAIEKAAAPLFESALTYEELNKYRLARNTMAILSERKADGKILGFLIYDVKPYGQHLLRMLTAPDERRRGVGRLLMQKTQRKLGRLRPLIRYTVPERNLDAQLFLKALKFRARDVVRDFFDDQDGFNMVYDSRENQCDVSADVTLHSA